MEVQRGVAAKLRFPEPGGDAVTLSDPTVTVVRDSDGETLVAAQKATEEEGTWTFDLKGAEIPDVDLLAVTWADEDSTYRQEVEVVGGFVCSLQDIKDKLDESAETTPDDDKIRRQRELATRDVEAACWTAFRHRYARETLSGDRSEYLLLNQRNIVRILSLEVGGDVFTESEIEDIAISDIGLERNRTEWPGGWPRGTNNVIVTYIYGYASYPAATNPIRDLAADYLVQHPTDWEGRATSYTDNEGNNYRMVTAGERGARFNVPSVNAFVRSFGSGRIA